MKILLVNLGHGWGGGQEQLGDLATELTEQGDTVHFLCRVGSHSLTRYRDRSFTVHTFTGNVSGILKTVRLLRHEAFDAVLVTREHDLVRLAITWKMAQLTGVRGRFVMAYHTATSRRQPFISIPDAIICISGYVKNKLLEKNRIEPHRLHVVHNGITTGPVPKSDKFNRKRHKSILNSFGFPTIGMIGAFFKNQQELVAMTPKLLEGFPDIRIILLGNHDDPSLLPPLLAQIKELRLEQHVIIPEPVERAKMAEIFADLDLSVSTFRNEGFGLVHIESLAAGTPVVAYDEGGQVDILSGSEAGVLVHGTSEDFAEAVLLLLNDDERRYAMGKKGVELVRSRFSSRTMAAEYRRIMAAAR